jgi:hypothetical protein
VAVQPGTGTLEAAAAAKPAGTTFCLAAGQFVLKSSVVAQYGDQFLGAGRTATFVVGDGTVKLLFVSSNALYTVSDLDISGAVGDLSCRPDCGRAFSPGAGMTMRNVRCHHNDNQCIGSGGGHVLVVNSELDHNGMDEAFWGFSAAAIKRVRTSSLEVRNSSIHDNGWNGLWCDHCEGSMVIEDSTITNNGSRGIVWEASGGYNSSDRAVIRNNVIKGNNTRRTGPGAGVTINSSQDITISGNTFGGNLSNLTGYRAILILDDSRSFALSNVAISANALNGDAISGCALAGVTSCT